MTLFALIAVFVAAFLFAFAAGKVIAGRRYQTLLSAFNELHERKLDGASAIIQSLKKDADSIRPSLIRACAHLIWSAQELDAAGKPAVGQARRAAAQALTEAFGSDPEADFGVKKLTGENVNVDAVDGVDVVDGGMNG